MASDHLSGLMKELAKKVKEARKESEHIGKQDEHFERLVKMSRKELEDELRALRKELAPGAISRMPKHQLVNEIIRCKMMLDADSHVPHHEEEVREASRKAPAQKHAELPSKDLPAAVKKRKASAQVLRVAEKRKAGMSFKDAWAAVKAEDAKKAEPPRHQPPNPKHVEEVEAARPKAHKEEEAKMRRAKVKAAARANPERAELAKMMMGGMSFTEAAAALKAKLEKAERKKK